MTHLKNRIWFIKGQYPPFRDVPLQCGPDKIRQMSIKVAQI